MNPVSHLGHPSVDLSFREHLRIVACGREEGRAMDNAACEVEPRIGARQWSLKRDCIKTSRSDNHGRIDIATLENAARFSVTTCPALLGRNLVPRIPMKGIPMSDGTDE